MAEQSASPEWQRYFSGAALYGDDFDEAELAAWARDEAEAYAGLGAGIRDSYRYHYHALNELHAFRWLPQRRFPKALGIGSAYGDEFQPLLDRIDDVTLIDPSNAFNGDGIGTVPVRVLRPNVQNSLEFEAGSFDLVLCFSTLHHVANVSYLVKEVGRVLKPGGFAAFREPTCSMGDWREPRRGLTKRERGIPVDLFRSYFQAAGLKVEHESPCVLGPLLRLWPKQLPGGYNDRRFVYLDAVLSRLLSHQPYRYHRTQNWQKLAPSSHAFVVTRPA